MARTILAALLALELVSVGCQRGNAGRRDDAPPSDTPPSASIITLGVRIATCDDVDLCLRECDAGRADPCRRLAASYAMGSGVVTDEAKATALYERACALKDPSACVFAGQMYEYAHGVAKDDARAAGYYERACDAQDAAGCYNLAIMYENARGVPRDRSKAGDLYQTACTAGAKHACEKAAEMHQPERPPF